MSLTNTVDGQLSRFGPVLPWSTFRNLAALRWPAQEPSAHQTTTMSSRIRQVRGRKNFKEPLNSLTLATFFDAVENKSISDWASGHKANAWDFNGLRKGIMKSQLG